MHLLQKALKIRKETLGSDNVLTADSYANVGNGWFVQN